MSGGTEARAGANAANAANAVCPRCGGGFHCGARDATCACFDLKLSAEMRRQLAAQYGSSDCLCLACLLELSRPPAVEPRS